MTETLTETITGTIHYGFGKEYLPNWGIKEALREIYQNFLDFGEYEEETVLQDAGGKVIGVKLTNTWEPESLEYLRIGRSEKSNPNAVGKHGEGLKMAFLILLREGFNSNIFTNKYSIWPTWYHDAEIGDCFCFEYEKHDMYDAPYSLTFQCGTEDFKNFKANLITEMDVIYSHYQGDIVDKEKGNIYSGGLWVAKVDNMSRSYNIKPEFLPLDRDRSVPRAFDVSYHASKINDAYGKWNARDTAYSDTAYIETIPEEIKETFKPRHVGNNIEFTYKDENNVDQVVRNSAIVEALKRDSFFDTAIKSLKRFLAKQLGLYDMLIEFQKKHVHSTEARQDFDLILEKVNKI